MQQLVENVRRSIDEHNAGEICREVYEAILQVDRSEFIPSINKHLAEEDVSIAIGYDQSSSQPSIVARMFSKLNIQSEDSVLEVGSGCGYPAALAAHLARKGNVVTIEYVPELAKIAAENLKAWKNVKVVCGDGSLGYAQEAPYDVIFLSAGARKRFDPGPFLDQLKPGGRFLFPRRLGDITLLVKNEHEIVQEYFYGSNFLPLKGANSGL